MKKLVLLCVLIIVFDGQAQNYIKRSAEEPVYDVEVIVFGRNLAQPTVDGMQQAMVYDQQEAVEVDFLPPDEEWPIIKIPPEKLLKQQPQTNPDSNMSENSVDNLDWEIPLNEEPIDYEVLVWYLKSQQLIGAVINLLDNNPQYKPLIRKIWRQPVTPFNNPLYVKVNNHQHKPETDSENLMPQQSASPDFNFNRAEQSEVKDFQIDGQVALSQGRFTHLHIKFNYYRINDYNEVLIYGSKQQRQIQLNQWQYFDHPQFGVLIKVTAVKAEELL